MPHLLQLRGAQGAEEEPPAPAAAQFAHAAADQEALRALRRHLRHAVFLLLFGSFLAISKASQAPPGHSFWLVKHEARAPRSPRTFISKCADA